MREETMVVEGYLDASPAEDDGYPVFVVSPGFTDDHPGSIQIVSLIEDILIDWSLGCEPFYTPYHSLDLIREEFEKSKAQVDDPDADYRYFKVTLYKQIARIDGKMKCACAVSRYEGHPSLKFPYDLFELPDEKDWEDYKE